MVQLLLLKGADKDALDKDGWTPLFMAASNGHVDAALALLTAGADVSLRCDMEESVLHAAAEHGLVDIMNAAIERGADMDSAADSNQRTPLHRAALYNKAEAIDVLVEAGANIEERDFDGRTPLHDAAVRSNLEAVLALLKHGAHVNAQTESLLTPLHGAARSAGYRGAPQVVDLLLRSGADETILDDDGRAAADQVGEAVEEEDQVAEDVERVCQLLVNAPADRAWRRRGYLVLCRAHPDKMQHTHECNRAHAGVARRTRSGAKLPRTETGDGGGAAEGSTVDERRGGDWAAVVARVLGLQEEGIFRSIMGYL